MDTAKLFKTSRSQAVRLPKEFRMPGKEVKIHREGNKVILEPVIHILPVDKQAAECAAKIRANLKRKGTPIGPYDLLIAGVAIALDLTLVSNNTNGFKRVDGLKLENWSK